MDDFESVAFAGLPTSREDIGGHAGHVGDPSTLAHFGGGSGCFAAHDGGVDLGEEVRHQRFTFLIDDQKIQSAVPPRNIAVDADAESQDDFS